MCALTHARTRTDSIRPFIPGVAIGFLTSGFSMSPSERYPKLAYSDMRLKSGVAPLVQQFRSDVMHRLGGPPCAPMRRGNWLPKTLTIFSRSTGHLPSSMQKESQTHMSNLVKAAKHAGWSVVVLPPEPASFEHQLRTVAGSTIVVGDEGAAFGKPSVTTRPNQNYRNNTFATTQIDFSPPFHQTTIPEISQTEPNPQMPVLSQRAPRRNLALFLPRHLRPLW